MTLIMICGVASASFPLDALQPGLEGYAITAGPNNTLERFSVEVLALQYDVGTGFPVVLVRASGPFIERSGGIAAGMSGSPAYLPFEGQDVLLGAIAFVFPNSDHTLALVTPIEVMRTALPPTVAVHTFGRELFGSLGPAVPVSTPLLLAGISTRASHVLDGLFRSSPVDLLPIQTNGVSPKDDESYVLEPGSAISVQLVRGDVTVAAIGTVTAVEQGHVLAFGHPLLGQGRVSFVLSPAFVSYIVPSNVVPFKLANSGRRILGSITEDRPAAITGPLDLEPDLLPVTLTLTGKELNESKSFEVTRDERYYAPLIATATLQVFDEVLKKIGPGTSEVAWNIHLGDGETLNLLEQVSDPNDIASATSALAATPLTILADNVFQPADIDRIALNIRYQEEQNTAEIIEVKAEDDTLDPGQDLVAFLRLQPFRQESVVKTLRIALPDTLSGPVTLTFRGGNETSDDDDNSDDPLSFGELLVALRDNLQASELVVETAVDGETTRLQRLSFPYLLSGKKTLDITVSAAKDFADEKSMPGKEAPVE